MLLVRERSLARKRNGEDYLRLKLCDCTGILEAVAWDGARELHELAQPGVAIRARGRYERVRALRRAAGRAVRRARRATASTAPRT